MIRLLITAACLSGGIVFAAPSTPSAPAYDLFANQPADRWQNAYPVGNGSMGGMAMGTFPEEKIILNHDAIWSRPKRVELPANSRKAGMDEAFRLAMQGDYAGAQAAYCQAKDKGNSIATFQTLGHLSITHLGNPAGPAPAIQRRLDPMSGASTVTTKFPDGGIKETLIASFPDQCLVVRLETDLPQGLRCKIALDRPAAITWRFAKDDEAGFDGDCGTRFATRVRVLPEQGGKVSAEGNALVLDGGKAATLIIAAATDYHRDNPRSPIAGEWAAKATRTLDAAAKLGWTGLRQRAEDDHRKLMGRCQLDLGRSAPEIEALSTPERMARVRKGEDDPELINRFFQFGRHLLVSSSRPGSLPPNLQGLWEGGLAAAWNGDFHLNINVQMNLWPACVTGLDECNEPYFALLSLIHKYGAETAASLGCRGYVAGLASDAWGQTDFVGGPPEYDSFILGGHWAQQHLMERYRFTRDRRFLQETAWPILKDGSLFLLDWLRENPADGMLVSGPGGSPENKFTWQDANGKTQSGFISNGSTIDHAIAWETFSDTLECAKLLEIEDDFTRQVAAALKRVPPPAIGQDGRIMEWNQPFGEAWTGHRHKSHLYGLHPGRQISLAKTPELAKAAGKSIDYRMAPGHGDTGGGGRTGWNLAWTANLWARLHEGDKALDVIREQLRTQVNDNLFNRCGAPWQIDGNLGTPAAIAEMLVQSDADGITLLPALPAAWKTGSARGLRARGGYEVNVAWKDGKVTAIKILSPRAGKVRVTANGGTREVATSVK